MTEPRTTAAAPTPGPPDAVRARVVHVAAQALPAVGQLPPALRKVAAFAPQRRARLGGTQILAALEDDDVRQRVATQVVARGDAAALAAELGAPAVDLPERDPVEVAALLWLVRPEGWEGAYAAALARHAAGRAQAEATDDAEQRARLERQVVGLQEDLAALRAEQRAELDTLRAENTTLRRRLGEARASARAASSESDAATSARRAAEERAGSAVGAAEAEARRLRRQVGELQAEVAELRSGQRAARRTELQDATLRTRLLLDTVVSAAQGLQRELGLPAVEGTVAERYERGLAGEGSRAPSAAGALGSGSPALLEQLMTMPRARLVVDGYNVTKQTWPSASLEVQRLRLVNGLAPIVARTGAETTVVFDAASSPVRPVVAAPRGVRVAFSPEHVIADDVIRDLVALEPEGRVVVVVTSDQAVARDVRRSGATVMDAVALAGLLTR